MGRPYSLHIVPVLSILLPCVLIGLIGYKWIELEREVEATRSEKAARTEAAWIRDQLVSHLAAVTGEVSGRLSGLPGERPAFAPPPPLPEIVESAFVFTAAGKLVYPNYQTAYLETTRTYKLAGAFSKAASLLNRGSLSLAAKRYREAESSARQILDCCADTRDEYGMSFALYAAVQIVAASEARGRLNVEFPLVAGRLEELLRRGDIGHHNDLQGIASLAARVGGGPDAARLLGLAQEQAKRIQDQDKAGERLETWVLGTALASAQRATFSLHAVFSGERPRLTGVYRAGDNILVLLFSTEPLSAWVAAQAARAGHFDAVLAEKEAHMGTATLRTPMLPEAPDFELSLRPRETDPGMQRWRERLFAAALAAAVLLILLVGCFAFRDVARELRLASLRSTFVSSVTHELKTPLTSIRLLAETLRLKRLSDPATGDQMLSAIIDESERLAQLVNNVLTFARIEKDSHPYHQTPVNLPEALCDAVRRFQCILNQRGFRLCQEADRQPMWVLADPEALKQAVLNLLDNAVKYSGQSREILLGIHRREKEVEIRVTDQGIGVSPGAQKRIFQSFYRTPEAAREAAGTGLGLTLVTHFAHAHGGRATVLSAPGKGSAFSLWLPLMENDGQDSDR